MRKYYLQTGDCSIAMSVFRNVIVPEFHVDTLQVFQFPNIFVDVFSLGTGVNQYSYPFFNKFPQNSNDFQRFQQIFLCETTGETGPHFSGFHFSLPKGSMGLVYLPTFIIKINHSCRQIYHFPWIRNGLF